MSKIIKSDNVLERNFLDFERDVLQEIVEEIAYEADTSEDIVIETPEQIKANVDAIYTEAREEAKRKVQEAYDEGFKKGTEAGHATFAESVGEAAESLNVAGEALKIAREEFLSSLEPQVMDLVRIIAERILRRDLHTDKELVLKTIRACLVALVDCEELKVRVNSNDLESLRNEKSMLLEEFDCVKSLNLIEDEDIESGGCIVESNTLHVDATIESQFDHIINEMME